MAHILDLINTIYVKISINVQLIKMQLSSIIFQLSQPIKIQLIMYTFLNFTV